MNYYTHMKTAVRNPRHILKSILLLAFVLRLVFILILEPEGFYLSDTRHYDRAALSLLSGDGFGEKYNRAPLYPTFMASIYFVMGHSFTAVRLAEALLGVVLCWLVYQISIRLFRKSVALLAAFFAAIFPHFIILTGLLYSTHIFTVFLAASILTLLIAEEKKSIFFLMTSAGFAGLATLTIPAMFFVLPFWMLWMLLRPGQIFTQKLIWIALFAMTTVAVLTPWTLRNYQKYGRFTLVRPVPHTAFPNLDDLKAQKDRINSGFKDTTDYLKEHPNGTDKDRVGNILSNYIKHPVRSAQYMLSEMAHFWSLYPDRLDTQSMAYQKRIRLKDERMVKTGASLWQLVQTLSIITMAPIFLFALVGLFIGHPTRWNQLLLVFTILAMTLGYSLIYAEVRYRIPIEPYVLMFTSVGIWYVYHRFVLRLKKANKGDATLHNPSAPPEISPVWRKELQPLDHFE